MKTGNERMREIEAKQDEIRTSYLKRQMAHNYEKDIKEIKDKLEMLIKIYMDKPREEVRKELAREIKELIQKHRLFYTAAFMDEFNKILGEDK